MGGGRLQLHLYLEELIKGVVGLCGEACVDLVVRLPYPEDGAVSRLVGAWGQGEGWRVLGLGLWARNRVSRIRIRVSYSNPKRVVPRRVLRSHLG